MNPFEYGKSFHNKSYPKRIVTLTQQNPRIFRGGTMFPPPPPQSLDTLKEARVNRVEGVDQKHTL